MCGFTGFISFSDESELVLNDIIREMNVKLYNRGPDSDGFYIDASHGIALGHRRLAIQDLSPAGHQPMCSESGRYVLVFNGEVYNHLELRKKLGRERWRGHSDTETILACIDKWGFQDTLAKLTGMFAIALWDINKKTLTLARDRLGEKPLYYAKQNGTLIFGSELKALKQHPDFKSEINRDALCLYMRHNCIPAPYSIYNDTYKLLPGTCIEFDTSLNGVEFDYWSATQLINTSVNNKFQGSAEDAVKELDSILGKSVHQQVLSDVPVGAFLSGGIDSTAIVALLQSNATTKVKTFTIGFDNKSYNEAEHAKLIANHLGTDHTELYLSPKDSMEVIPELPILYDEPFADSSQIPTYLVSKLAKSHVTVALSGDGGDELFAGYNRHKLARTLWPKVNCLPTTIRSFLSSSLLKYNPNQLDKLNLLLPGTMKMRQLGDKLHKSARVLSAKDDLALYKALVSHFEHPEKIVINGSEPGSIITNNKLTAELTTTEKMMALDLLTYMPDDILVKVDRAAMGTSLETRVPMLDHSVVEFAWSLPIDIKLKDGITKWPLRELLYKYVPKELIERPKMGFALPLDSWLRGPLRDWANGLLAPERIIKDGFFYEHEVNHLWQEHLSGITNNTPQLWCILMFNAWLDNQ